MNVGDSRRLSYHFITENDAEFLYQLDQDEEVMHFISGGKKNSRQAITDTYIPRLAAYSNQSQGWGLWQARLKSDNNRAIGWILVRPMGFFTGHRDDTNLELGWRFSKPFWGQGMATEAASAVIGALSELGYRQFSAIALEENSASIKVMKKLGMKFCYKEHYADEVFNAEVLVYTLKR